MTKQTPYTQTAEAVLRSLETSEFGLSEESVKARLLLYGKNVLTQRRPDGWIQIFFRQFQSSLIYILLVVSIILFAIHEPRDAGIILFILIFNSVVGAIQEGRAQSTLMALKQLVETTAVVIRDGNGEEKIVPDSDLVPGDIVVLKEGQRVPADSRVLESRALTIDESSITGESIPVVKIIEPVPFPENEKELLLPDQLNMVFRGTSVVSGAGLAVVVTTGMATAIGEISQGISDVKDDMPLKTHIRSLSRVIIAVVLGVSLVLVLLGLVQGQSLSLMLRTVISLAVSVIPEGLPIVLTLVLANGVWRMSKRKALVKKLAAVEALGQANIIAVDKTGTITKNELVVQKLYMHGKIFNITGSGFEPKGQVMLGGAAVSIGEHPELVLAGRFAAMSANAKLLHDETSQSWKVRGDPTEGALLVFAEKLGFAQSEFHETYPLVQDIPFDYQVQYHASVHENQGKRHLVVMGSPERLLELSHFPHGAPAEIKHTIETFSKDALRVIAFGFREVDGFVDPKHLPALTFGGLFAMRDVLHSETQDAVTDIIAAGIRMAMITGDHKITAEAIAREAGIFKPGDKTLTGYELDNMNEQQLRASLSDVTVFARVTPEHKLRIVRAYQSLGNIVAMTGDGVNDAPSLVAADLGIAMGKTGTEVAKEAADIVLLDDNVATIAAAVEEGRSIYHTIQRVILYLFSTSLGEVLTIASALAIGFPLPVLPVQILWLNFVTDGFLDVALATEPQHSNLLMADYRKPNRYLVNKLMALRMGLMAVVMTLVTLYIVSAYEGASAAHMMTAAMTTLAVLQWFNAWNCRSEIESIFRLNPFANRFLVLATLTVIVLQIFALYTQPLSGFLRTVPLAANEWLVIISLSSAIIIVEEIRKIFARRKLYLKGIGEKSSNY